MNNDFSFPIYGQTAAVTTTVSVDGGPLFDLSVGYRVIPIFFEFWQGRPDRLHDRFAYRLRSDSHDWVIERLSP